MKRHKAGVSFHDPSHVTNVTSSADVPDIDVTDHDPKVSGTILKQELVSILLMLLFDNNAGITSDPGAPTCFASSGKNRSPKVLSPPFASHVTAEAPQAQRHQRRQGREEMDLF